MTSTLATTDLFSGFRTKEFDPFQCRTKLADGDRIRVGDVELWYHDSGGDGEVIFLMGGFTAGHFVFDFAKQFLKGYRLVTCEPRGLGLSDKPDPAENDYSAVVWAEDASKLLEVLNIKKAHIWAEGFGSYIGIRLAAERPDLIASLVTSHDIWAGYEQRTKNWNVYSSIVTNLGTSGRGAKLLAQWMDSGALPWFVDWEARNIEETVNAEMAEATVGYGLLHADVRQDVARIKVPTRVILGGTAKTDKPEHPALQEMRKNISEFDVVVVEGADEGYGNVTHPGEFAAAAREFFEAHSIARRKPHEK